MRSQHSYAGVFLGLFPLQSSHIRLSQMVRNSFSRPHTLQIPLHNPFVPLRISHHMYGFMSTDSAHGKHSDLVDTCPAP